jgi:hypothetical protein
MGSRAWDVERSCFFTQLWRASTHQSHTETDCLMNKQADELAELGRTTESSDICPGSPDVRIVRLRVRLAVRVRDLAESSGSLLSRDRGTAPNRNHLEKTAASNTLRVKFFLLVSYSIRRVPRYLKSFEDACQQNTEYGANG